MENCETMKARILRVEDCALLVNDCETRGDVLALTQEACRFCEGDLVCIWYDGAMTRSIPPQIRACRVRQLSC